MAIKTKNRGRVLEVLHVEDNLGDAFLLKQVLKRSGIPVHLNHVEDGDSALLFLNRKGPYSKSSKPDVVLLDLKIPKKDGLTVLAEIRKNPDWQNIPVMILTGSDNHLDLDWAIRLNASGYMAKPMDLDQFGKLVKFLREHWVKSFRNRQVIHPN